MRARARRGGEEGSALIIALVFATVFSLLVATVLSFAEVGLRASAAFDGKGRSAYAADGAVNAAINRFRGGGPCGDYTAPAGPDGRPLDGTGVIVRCVDDDRPASGRATKPVNALLSLGPEGIATYPGFEQRVLGNIFSNSTVAAGATLVVQGQVSATGECSGPIQTSPPTPLRCANTGVGADPTQGRDPDYTRARTVVPARRTPPACPAGWLVALEPGHYDDAGALSAFTTTTGSCPGKVVWLKPGDYYLDFTFRGGAGAWTIDDPAVDVVAGTPRGWDPSAPDRPSLSVPGSCKTDADPDPVDGVQLVAGGGTHLQVTRGRVELCAEPSPTDQSIALFGMAPDRPTHTLEPTDWARVSGFTDPGAATVIGESPPAVATAPLAVGTAESAAMTLTAFRPRVPAGSLVDAATLRVAHREDGAMDDTSSSLKVVADFEGSTCTGAQAVAVPVNTGAAMIEHRIDLRAACGLDGPADFADLDVDFTAALATGGDEATATLDGIAVEVAYRVPTTAKPTAVAAASGFTDATAALEIGEQPEPLTADAALSPASPSASITVAGLGEPPIPAGSTIDAAVLRVAHREEGGVAPSVTVSGGTCADLAVTPRAGAIADDRMDLMACGLDTAAELVGLTATYQVALTGAEPAEANLDGMWLELVYRPPPVARPPATVSTTGFADAGNARVIDGATADAVLDATTSTATLTAGGYDQPPAVVPGSFIDAAVLRVAHHDVGDMGPPRLDVAFPGANSCPAPALALRPGGLGEDRIDLRACGLTDPAQLAGLTVTYTATLAAGGVAARARIDGLVLELAHRPPTTRRAATATTTAPGFDPPDEARAIDGTTADATLAEGAAPASVTLGGYDRPPLPAGSAIDSAVLRVAHHDDAWTGPVTLSAAFPGSTCAAPQALPRHPAAIGVDAVDLKACGLDDPAELPALAATYTAHPPGTTLATQVPGAAAAAGFADPDRGRAVDGVTTDASLAAPGTPSASITLSGYAQAPPPPGAAIDAATLRLVHEEGPGAGPVTVGVSFTGGSCSSRTFARASLGEDTIDLRACGLTDPSQLPGLTVTFEAGLDGGAQAATVRLDGAEVDLTYRAQSGTARLDGMELDIVFRPPAYRPLDGCLTAQPYPDPGTCALVRVSPPAGDTATRFVAQGSVYAPSAALDISMAGLTGQVLTRGLVARAIRLGLRADPGYKRPAMGVPPEPVRFTAYPDVTARAATATASGFAGPEAALAVDGDTTSAALDTSSPSASVTLAGFAQGALPAGAVIDAAVLRVVHRHDVDVGSVTVTVGGFASGPCAPQRTFPPLALHPSSGPLGEDQIDLTACGLSDPAQLADLTVTYTATLAGPPATAASAHLDGITLDVLSGPLLRARVAFDSSSDTVQVLGWSVLR